MSLAVLEQRQTVRGDFLRCAELIGPDTCPRRALWWCFRPCGCPPTPFCEEHKATTIAEAHSDIAFMQAVGGMVAKCLDCRKPININEYRWEPIT